MKNILYSTIVALSTIFCATSCEDFLNRPTLGVMDESNFFISADMGYQSVIQCYYSTFHDVYGYEKPRFAIGDVCTDDAEKGGSDAGDIPEIYEMAYGNAISSNGLLYDYWKQMYKAIGDCNVFLDNYKNYNLVDGEGYELETAIVERYEAEVRFLRAFAYFELAKTFGGVPLVTKTLSPADSRSLHRASEAETFAFIISELSDCTDALPRKNQLPSSELGRITQEAAYAMLARVYMFAAKDNESYVKDAYEAMRDHVIGQYTLESDYQSLWLPDNYYSDEAILVDIRGDDSGNRIYGSFVPVFCSPRSTGAYGFDQPTQNLVDEFETGDPRLLFTILQQGDVFPTGGAKDEVLNFSTYPNTGYHSRKAFLIKSRRGPGWGDDAWSYMHIRYADLLLLYAESIVRTGGDKSIAVNCINEVRKRANNSRHDDLEAKERQLIVASKPLPMVQESDDLLMAIKHERRVELAMEQLRFYDLKRWGDYVNTMSEYRGGGFQFGKSEYFPIPQVEIDRTENGITQNPGY